MNYNNQQQQQIDRSSPAFSSTSSNHSTTSGYGNNGANINNSYIGGGGMDQLETHLFVIPPPSTLICPLHNGIFNQPFIAKCGHTFCSRCILIKLNKQVPNNNNTINNNSNNSISPQTTSPNASPINSSNSTSTSELLMGLNNISISQQQHLLLQQQQQLQHHHNNYMICPIDKTQLKENEFFPNLALSSQINDLLIYCRWGIKKVNGELVPDDQTCQQKIKLGSRFEHEKICDHAIIQCPYNKSCPPLKRYQLKQHTQTCNFIHCHHRSAGCTFEGTKQQLDDHILGCGYESIKDYIQRNEEQINVLRTHLDEKQTENDFLKKSIVQLTAGFNQLALKLEEKTNKFEGTMRHIQASLEATQHQLSETVYDLNIIKKNSNLESVDIVDLKIPQLKCKGTFVGHNGPIWCMTVTNGMLISGSSDMKVKIWDLVTLKCKQILSGHEGIVHTLAVIGNRLFSGSSDQTIRVWDLDSFECLSVLRDDNTVCALAVAAGYLFSGSYQHIKVWDLESYECVQTLKGNNHWVRALTVSGGYLYSGAYNVVKVWDLANFECVQTISGGSGSIYSLAVSNRRLLAGTYENTIVVWNLDTFEVIQKLDGHIGAVYTLAVSGQKFYSGSYDSTIKVWNIDSLICVQTLNRHTSSVESLVVSSGCVFSGSADNSIKVWR